MAPFPPGVQGSSLALISTPAIEVRRYGASPDIFGDGFKDGVLAEGDVGSSQKQMTDGTFSGQLREKKMGWKIWI